MAALRRVDGGGSRPGGGSRSRSASRRPVARRRTTTGWSTASDSTPASAGRGANASRRHGPRPPGRCRPAVRARRRAGVRASGAGDLPHHLADDVGLLGEASIGRVVGVGGDEPELWRLAARDLDALDDEAVAVPQHEELAGGGALPRGVDDDAVAVAHLGLHGVAAHAQDAQRRGVGSALVADHALGMERDRAEECRGGPRVASASVESLRH